jgi:hypothetical protein
MPKQPTHPILYNKVLQVSITKLKEWEYLNLEQLKSGTITWSINGNQTGCISITTNTQSQQPYIELNFKYNDEPRNYKVSLVSMPSNLGKGLIWYFLCPKTNKRCRKLYSIGGYFLHREAFDGCMYESQSRTKPKGFFKLLEAKFNNEDLCDELYKKHFKRTYAGKPTKRYLRIIAQIQEIDNTELEKLF